MHKASVTAVPGFPGVIGIGNTIGRNWIDFACQLPHSGNRRRQGLPNFMFQFKYSTMYYCLPSLYQWFADHSRLALLPDSPLKNINQIFIK